MKNILLKILIIALSISALLGIVIILFDFKSDTAEKILITSLIVFGFSIPGLCCSTIYEKKYRKPLSIAGIATCLSGCIYFLLIVWEISDFDFLHDLEWRLMLLLPIMSLSFAHLSLVSSIDDKTKKIKLIQTATLVLSVIIDIIIFLAIIFDIEAPWQMFAILAILIALGTLATPIINKITKAPAIIPEENIIANEATTCYSNNPNNPPSAIPIPESNNAVFSLAQELYTMSIGLKRIPEINLGSNTNRTELLKILNKMQSIIFKMNKEMLQEQSHSLEYFELIIYMNEILCNCTSLLLTQEDNYKATVTKRMLGFHNLPKAFLPLDNRMKISPKKAMAYFESYC